MQLQPDEIVPIVAILGFLVFLLFLSMRVTGRYRRQKKRYAAANHLEFQPSKIIGDSEIPFLIGMEVKDRLTLNKNTEWATIELTIGDAVINQDLLLISSKKFPSSLHKSTCMRSYLDRHLKYPDQNKSISDRFQKYDWYCNRITIVSGDYGICFIKSGMPFAAEQIDQIVADIQKEIRSL